VIRFTDQNKLELKLDKRYENETGIQTDFQWVEDEKTRKNTKKYFGDFWNFLEFFGIFWNFLEFFGIFWEICSTKTQFFFIVFIKKLKL